MKKLKYFLIIFLTGSSFISCNPKSKSGPIYPVPTDLKAAFNYKPGSYWIYRDSLTGNIDSFAVQANEFVTPKTSGSQGAEVIYITVQEYASGSLVYIWQYILNVNGVSINWFQDYNKGDWFFEFHPAFNYPFKVGDVTYATGGIAGGDSPYLTKIYSNYPLGGNNYSNVAEVHHIMIDKNIPIYDIWLYANDAQGIVKMRIHHYYDSVHKVWELQRCHIVK